MKQQRGFSLIVAVVFLMVAAIIGLYAMRSALTQDRASANIYNKTITTNAAEYGATRFYEWLTTKTSWPSNTDQGTWTGNIPNTQNDAINFGTNGYYWLNPIEPITGCTTNPCWDDVKKQVTAVITGNLVQGTGTSRTILGTSKVRVKISGPEGVILPKMPAALTIGGNVSSFSGPTSQKYRVAGGTELSIATNSPAATTSVKSGITKNLDANHYSGNCSSGACISNTDLGIWGDPVALSAYLQSIRNASNVTYITGNVSDKLPVCSGVLIITGTLTIPGKTCSGIFNGVIIVLGGSLTGNGLGGLIINGALYVTNLFNDPVNGPKFGQSSVQINGGGNGSINYAKGNFTSSLTQGSQNGTYKILEWANTL